MFPSIDHVTEVSFRFSPVTSAVNCCVPPLSISINSGLIVISSTVLWATLYLIIAFDPLPIQVSGCHPPPFIGNTTTVPTLSPGVLVTNVTYLPSDSILPSQLCNPNPVLLTSIANNCVNIFGSSISTVSG